MSCAVSAFLMGSVRTMSEPMRYSFCAMILFFGVCLYAEGQVCLHPDENVSQMMEKHKSFNVTMDGKSSGYRVQIFFSAGL